MADKSFYKDAGEYQPKLVNLRGQVAIGATGAVGATKGRGYSIARIGTGHYTVTFQNGFSDLLEAEATFQVPAGPTGPIQVSVGQFSATARTLEIYTWNAAGSAAADPTPAGSLMFRCAFLNTSVR